MTTCKDESCAPKFVPVEALQGGRGIETEPGMANEKLLDKTYGNAPSRPILLAEAKIKIAASPVTRGMTAMEGLPLLQLGVEQVFPAIGQAVLKASPQSIYPPYITDPIAFDAGLLGIKNRTWLEIIIKMLLLATKWNIGKLDNDDIEIRENATIALIELGEIIKKLGGEKVENDFIERINKVFSPGPYISGEKESRAAIVLSEYIKKVRFDYMSRAFNLSNEAWEKNNKEVEDLAIKKAFEIDDIIEKSKIKPKEAIHDLIKWKEEVKKLEDSFKKGK